MNKVLMAVVVLAVVMCLSVAVYADGPASNWLASVQKNGTVIQAQTVTTPLGDIDSVFDLGSLGLWDIRCIGSATLNTTTAPATLTGNFDGRIWSYEYTADDVDLNNIDATNWTCMKTLVDSFSAQARDSQVRPTTFSSNTPIQARFLRIRYNTTLTSAGNTTASGSASIDATAHPVPEPGSFMALGSMLAPLGFAFLKKRGS